MNEEDFGGAVTRSLVSLELARMTNSVCLELTKVIVIMNNEGRGDPESTARLCSGLR